MMIFLLLVPDLAVLAVFIDIIHSYVYTFLVDVNKYTYEINIR